MEKGNQNSAFFQNAAFSNLEYDVQQLYRQLARPVLCPVMAIPQDMLFNMPALGNIAADLNSRDKIMQSSVQNVFISSTSCFQSFKPHQTSAPCGRYDKKDAAVLTSKQNIYEKIQKCDVGTPTSKFDTFGRSNGNVQCLFKKDADHYLDKDEHNETSTSNTTDRDDRLRKLLKKLLAAKKREKQLAENNKLFKSLLAKVQNDKELVNNENRDLTEALFNNKKNNVQKNDYDAYYMNCPNIFFNPNKRRGNYNCKSKQFGWGCCKRYPCRPRQSYCYPISSQGRLMMLQKEKEMKRLLQAKKTHGRTTCESSCERQDFHYYNRKIKGILAKYKEQVDCGASCWPLKGSNTKGCCIANVSNHSLSSKDDKKKNPEMFCDKYDISHPKYSETATSTTVCTEESKSERKPSQQVKQEYYTSQKDFKGLETNAIGYVLQNTCDGVKSDSFPYLCSCFKRKLVHDKAILARTCCNNNLQSKGAQTMFSSDNKKNGRCCWVPKDDFILQGVPPNDSAFINRKINSQYRNDIYTGAADDTVRAIHNEKLQGIFDKYRDITSDLSNFTFPNLLGGNDKNTNILNKCDRLCEQIQKQRSEVKQWSCQTSGPTDILLNIMEKLEEVTKRINLYINEEKRTKQYLVQPPCSQGKSTFWNFHVQQSYRSNKLDANTRSPRLSQHHTGTQFSSNSQILKDIFQEESRKINIKKNVEEIVSDILQKVTAVETLKQRNGQTNTDLTNDSNRRLNLSDNPTKMFNKHKKITIAVNTDPLGLVSLLRMSTEALMRFLSYFPMVSSNPIFGITYKQSVSHYICNICGEIFQRSSQLSDHIEEHHNFQELRGCCVCRHTLELHQQPVGGLFTCQYCGRHFTRAYCCELHEQDCAKTCGLKHNHSLSLALLR